MSLSCGCEKGYRLCPSAERLWRAYAAAKDIERTLFDAVTTPGFDDPIIHDRWRLACDVSRTARRNYEKHVDGEDESRPVPLQLARDVYDRETVP